VGEGGELGELVVRQGGEQVDALQAGRFHAFLS